MRALIGATLLLGCFAMGCDDDSGGKVVMDMAVKVTPDMTMTFGTQTCFQVITCAAGCAGSTSCLATCASMGTQQAQTKYEALLTCGRSGCLAPYDAGATPACSGATDTSQTCQDCVAATAQSATCASQLTACENDK